MTGRPVAIAIARALNAAFFLATSAYGLLAYSPFAYQQFLKPEVIAWLPDFLAIHTALFWLVLLVTSLTLTDTVRLKADTTCDPTSEPTYVGSALRRTVTSTWLARAYLMAGAIAGVALILRPVMPSLGNDRRSFVVALIALVPPVWLGVIDHRSRPAPAITPSDQRHLLTACVAAGAAVWAAYAIGAPLRLARIAGVELPAAGFFVASASSAVAHLFVFMAVFLALVVIGGVASTARRSGTVEYWLLGIASGAAIAAVIYGLVFASLAFAGRDAAIAAALVGGTIAMVWSGVARHRVSAGRERTWSAMQLWLAPIAGGGSRRLAWATLGVLPLLAYGLVSATAGLDWNFLIQKLGALTVWVIAFAAAHASLEQPGQRRAGASIALLPLAAAGLFAVVAPFTARPQLIDRYAALDTSFRLLRDLRMAHTGETAAFYRYLKANTLVAPPRVTAPEVQFARGPLRVQPPPDIFLFLIDSLRRDYVSAYNPAVTFTPAIDRFASDSFVFDRAFTRYAGTGLAVPSIWSGGMLIHMLEQQPFEGRNALWKLLEADGYRRVMGVDHIMRDLLPARPALVELDRGVPPMDCEFCRTMRELQSRLLESPEDRRPVFSYTLPQNVHIAVASKRTVPEGHAYPGLFAPVAESVRQVDECFGRFIDFLRRTGRYDHSLVILTSDHGDSLGEEGRWGHSYFMVPEVMRIPLIMHVPPALAAGTRVDLNRVTFSTDITPTLYGLLGHDPADLGPLFGSPLVVPRDREIRSRRRESFLLASSYGAVYGMLRHNGRILYTADAMDGRDDLYDLSTPAGRRIAATGALVALNRSLITEQLGRLAALNHFVPQP